MKPKGQTQGCILRRSLMLRSFGADNQVRMRAFHFSWSDNLSCSSHVITVIFAASRSVPCMAYIVHVVTGVLCGEVEHMRCPCVDCLCLARRSSFSARAPVQSLTTVNQRRTDPCFKSHLCVKPVLILPNGLSKPGKRAHNRN